MILYQLPDSWIKYDLRAIQLELVEAKSALTALRTMPYQRSWLESLQQMELKREVAGTSRIEGAEFTERELEEALKESPEQLFTRSQRQAHAAVNTYRWIAALEQDRPIDSSLILAIHRRLVTGADDDHCRPGSIRQPDENVTFGQPRHRGAGGGAECKTAFDGFCVALQSEYRGHDPVIQALAAHYHLAAMHPFLDGNGRAARALEALMLQRAGLRDVCFIAMSNFYYDEKMQYLESLSASRAGSHDITPFLAFALRGVAVQSNRVLEDIRRNVQKAIFRNTVYDLFGRLETPRKRVIAKRQISILRVLLDLEAIDLLELYDRVAKSYSGIKNPVSAFSRDFSGLAELGAIALQKVADRKWTVSLKLEWASEITEGSFFEKLKCLPKAKTYSFLR